MQNSTGNYTLKSKYAPDAPASDVPEVSADAGSAKLPPRGRVRLSRQFDPHLSPEATLLGRQLNLARSVRGHKSAKADRRPVRNAPPWMRYRVNKGTAMFDYEVYFDDSGTHAESSLAVAPCYVSSKTQWKEFNRNRTDVLKDKGFEYFHTADFMLDPKQGRKPFCDWPCEKRQRVYRKLASIIRQRTRCEFAVCVPKDVYDKHASDEMNRNYAKDHYAFAVKCCLGLIWRWRMTFDVTSAMY